MGFNLAVSSDTILGLETQIMDSLNINLLSNNISERLLLQFTETHVGSHSTSQPRSRQQATGHINDPVPLIEKSRGLSPGGRFPPSFIHQVIIITGLNKLYNCMFSP